MKLRVKYVNGKGYFSQVKINLFTGYTTITIGRYSFTLLEEKV